uniref:Semaphorin-2A n=1 Tax=Strigamia maritima TaxID=126957 RepID=T1JFR9_STRMM
MLTAISLSLLDGARAMNPLPPPPPHSAIRMERRPEDVLLAGMPAHVREFSCGPLFYRTLYLDSTRDVLYVGALDKILRLPLTNINNTNCQTDSLTLKANSVPNCVSKGKSEHYDCRNHIRVIQPVGDGSRLYVCGTNAHNPLDWIIYSNLTKLGNLEFVPGIGDGIAKCPFDPNDNATAVWVEKGNPAGLPALYSGTVAEFTRADTVIFRTDLFNYTSGQKMYQFKRTIKYDSKWLDKPNFVGSYDIGEYVYFFFRETAVEYINCGKNIYSRVARVCKVTRYNSIKSNIGKKNGLMGSAICSFTINDIQDTFNGKFKEQATSSSAWLPVLNSKVPEPRPGQCVNDTQTLPDTVLNFIRGHPLMDSAVSHDRNKPAFYKRDLIFTHLVVDRLQVASNTFTVYYAGSNDGKVYKIVEWQDKEGTHSDLLDVFEVTSPESIRAMQISSKHKSLYVASDSRIRQVDMVMCRARYTNCVRCIRDPYCGWDKDASQCKPHRPNLLQDVTNISSGICDTCLKKRPMLVHWGQSVHLDKYIETSDGGLVILTMTENDNGRYDCKTGPDTLCSYNISVNTKTCNAPDESQYRKIYSDWCHEFEKYKVAMKSWQNRQTSCQSQNQNAHPNDVTFQNNKNPFV